MPCCGIPWSLLDKKGNQAKVVDIERPLIEHAWEKIASPTVLDKVLKDQRFELGIDWNYANFEHEFKRFKSRPVRDNGPNEVIPKKESLCLFRTKYENETDRVQKFTFKTERSTKTTASVSITKGFQLGGKLNLNFGLPTVSSENIQSCKVTGGLSGQFSISKTEGLTHEETLTWSVDTQVEVGKNKRCVAELIVIEEQFDADFTLLSTLTCMTDVLPMTIKHKKTGRQKVVEIPVERVWDVLCKEGFTLKHGEQKDVKKEDRDYTMYCDSKGIFRTVYGAEQRINIHYEDLDAAGPQAADPPVNPPPVNEAGQNVADVHQGPFIEEVDEGEDAGLLPH